MNGSGYLYVSFPYISKEKSVCYIDQFGSKQKLDTLMDDLKIFNGNYKQPPEC